ncbi:MAG: branched-chain amino acid transport system II carrier protein [Firmicutes bacterium]|nr:branched-chain amino acid transport system II carrier protein [Bacillota bacterium]
MNRKKHVTDSIVVGFALFAMFFGAGNVVFPPYIGMHAGEQWANGFLFYFIADIGLALVAMFAILHAGGADNITGRIGHVASKVLMCAVILCIGPMVAIPRTAATTLEMSVTPFFSGMSPVVFSIIFFAVILLLSIKQSAVIDIVGKILTPALLIGLLVLIVKGFVSPIGDIVDTGVSASEVTVNGIKSGYQTMDVLAAMAFGIIILSSADEKGYTDSKSAAKMIGIAAALSGVLLLIVYFGLTYLGATASTVFPTDISRANLVIGIVELLLGKAGLIIFAIVIALACITTAVALVSSAASFFAKLANDKISYGVFVVVICVSSAVISNLGLDMIIAIATPVLDIVYPPMLVLILLSWFGDKLHKSVYVSSVAGSLIASVLATAELYGMNIPVIDSLPLASLGLGWLTPAAVFGLVAYLVSKVKFQNAQTADAQNS